MAKAIVLLTRRPDLSVAAFQRHTREVHAPLVAAFPGLRRFVMNFTRPFPTGEPAAYDAVFEVWFDDADAMWAAFGSPEGAAEIADGHNFLDMSAFQIMVVDEEDGPVPR